MKLNVLFRIIQRIEPMFYIHLSICLSVTKRKTGEREINRDIEGDIERGREGG